MMFLQVEDLNPELIRTQSYDLVLMASGYEPRARYACQSLHIRNLDATKVAVVGFEENRDEGTRVENDEYFSETFGTRPIIQSARRDEHLYDLLSDTISTQKEHVKILIDYSSMPRLWYGALLNWARYREYNEQISLDFVYSVGKYDSPLPPMVINELLAIP